MDQEQNDGLNQTGKSLGASHAVADAAASAEALCRTLDSAKISSMAADLRATAAGAGGGPTMLKTKSPEDGRSQRSTSSSALLQEQEEEERRLTALSPEVAEFDLSRLRGTKAPTEEGGDKRGKGKKHHNHHGHGGGMGGNDDTHGHAAEHGQHGQGHHGGDHQFGGGPSGGYHHGGGGGNHHHGGGHHKQDDEGDADLANLAELVPGLRSRAGTLEEAAGLEGLNEEEGDNDMGMGEGNYDDGGREDERKMPAAASGQRSQRREGGGNRWSTQTRRPESPERNTRDGGGGGPGSPDASPQQRAGRIDNLDSMNVGVGHSRSAEDDPNIGGIGDGGSDDDDVAHALAAGAAAGLAGVVEADKAREAEDGDSNSNESLVTRDDAEPMPGEEPGEYDDLSGFGPDKDGGDHSSSSSRSSAGNDNGNSSSNNNANTSESIQRSAANHRKGNKVKKHLRKARNKNQTQQQPHDSGPAPKAPEHSSDGAIGGPTYHSHGGGSGHGGGGGRASPHQHQLTEPRLPPAPEPALHEYGAAGAASSATASGRDRAGRPVPLSGQSVASLSTQTATQTHEVRMPMYLPTFKPATGCTNASDFIVRCFVARLRSGITVVKHGRSRWCKSRLRILHVHSDGRSLTWKPALGEPSSSKRPPKLDLSTCQEVRHAWSPDPLNPMFTGTPILRQKCEAANAHKSFALVFPKRTVDITAVTADQCKVLMEGFSALCFRLQVANLAGKGGAGAPGANDKKGSGGRTGKSEQSEEDRTTASVTLTNTSRADLSPTARAGSAGNVGTGDRNRASRHYR